MASRTQDVRAIASYLAFVAARLAEADEEATELRDYLRQAKGEGRGEAVERLERLARSAARRVRSLELLVASCVGEAARLTEPGGIVSGSVAADAPVRGSWEGPAGRSLQPEPDSGNIGQHPTR
jgi:hypothetical protein